VNARGVVRVLATLVVVALVVGIGVSVYNAGVSAGLSEAAQLAAASGEAVPIDRFGWGYGAPYINGPIGWGFGGFFGILFSIFLVFLLIGLVRVAVGGRRGGPGHGGWGDRRARLEGLHRELHRGDAGETGQRPAGA
jgi:hypothetical protein